MRLFARVLACATTLILSGTAHAQDGANVFKGKTVTIIAGSASGGGVDIYARLLGRHFHKTIPGAPTIVVQNMPGAGSLAAARHPSLGRSWKLPHCPNSRPGA